MANRYSTAVAFTMEKEVVTLAARVQFTNSGVPYLDPLNSKGICTFVQNTPTFTGSVASGSATITSVSSFLGLVTGMVISGSNVTGTPTIGTVSAATGSVVLSAAASVASGAGTFTATGGQYLVQFGTQAPSRLDTYAGLLGVAPQFFVDTGSTSGTTTQAQVNNAAPDMMILSNQTKIATIPRTSTSGSTDSSLMLQFGNFTGPSVFTAANPANGEILRIIFVFKNSTAI